MDNDVIFNFVITIISKSQDALSLTEYELMELLDVGMAEVTSALTHISEVVCPPYQTVYIHAHLSFLLGFFFF